MTSLTTTLLLSSDSSLNLGKVVYKRTKSSMKMSLLTRHHHEALLSDPHPVNGGLSMLSREKERFLETAESIVKLTWERLTEVQQEKRISTQEALHLEATLLPKGIFSTKRECSTCPLWSKLLVLVYMSNIENRESKESILNSKRSLTNIASTMNWFKWVTESEIE